ncbi:MAG TPA: cell wall-binding repeat-containing protein [Acidimicrobiales bacterium]|jgi:putative cell wall-binding protein
MKQGPNRFRRAATACAAGTIALSFLSVLAIASPASAAQVPGPVGTTVAASAPTIRPNLANQAAGDWTVSLNPGAVGNRAALTPTTCGPNAAVIFLLVTDFNESGHVTFDHVPTVTAPSTVGNAGFTICGGAQAPVLVAPNTLAILYIDSAATTAVQPIVITNISYDTAAAAAGPVVVSGFDADFGYVNGTTANNITPLSASLDGISNPYDPTASNAAVSTPTFAGLFANTTPPVGPGTTTAAGDWEVPLTGAGNSWNAGDKIYITVARHNSTNCETAGSPDSVGFSGVPALSFAAAFNGATVTPTATASLAQLGSCSSFSGVNNVLVITFTNSGTLSSGTAFDNFGHTYAAEITVSGVSYAVSGDVTAGNQGNVAVSLGYNAPPTFTTTTQPNDTLVGGTSGGATGGRANANITITSVTVVANKPSVTIQANATSTGVAVTNQAISPITISEGTPGSLGGGVTGYACVQLPPPGAISEEWNATTSTPTATLGGGFGTGTIPVTVETTGTQTGPGTLEFQIPTASTGTPGTVTLSGLALNFHSLPSLLPAIQANFVYGGINAACAGTTAYAKNPFIIANLALRVFGQTQDATAAQIFTQFPPACTPGVPSATNETPAVLVTNGSYQDALSASYLAGQLGTSVLTTPTASVSQDALNALRLTGVTEVFVVGGPLAVSQSNVTQLQNTPAFNCGGVSQRTTIDGQPVNLVVQQIFGQTADGTAAAVATFPGAGVPGTGNFQGAYSGAFNDTTGSSGSPASSAPDTPVTTAILATDQSFTDAASSSAIAYARHFPLLLTGPSSLSPDAVTALTNDAVQQVIVMGGPIAISDSVLTQVEAMGISVLRVAGQDFTDTSQLLAQFELNSVNSAGITNGLDWDPLYVIPARGDYYTDAIVAPRLMNPGGDPILLTWDPNNEGNPSGTNYLGPFLHTVGQVAMDPGIPSEGTVNDMAVVGGPFAISNALETTMATSLNG